jgi:hypothetical protein
MFNAAISKGSNGEAMLMRVTMRQGLLLVALVCMMAAGVRGQSAPAGAGATGPAAATAPTTLPAGHPAIGTVASGTADGGVGATTTLPAGHPALDQLMTPGVGGRGGAMLGATTGPATSLIGSLNIAVVSGSANGTSTAHEAVTVELYQDGKLIKKLELKTDAMGALLVPDVPVMPPTDVVLSARHGGLFQQARAPSPTMDAPAPAASWKVFDPTEEKPAWTIAMQHILVEWAPDGSGARVTEMLQTNNPADRAWLGAKAGDKRVTMTIPLPANVEHIALGEAFDEDETRLAGNDLVTGTALLPGRCEYQLTYELPARNGAVELPIVTPAAVGNLIVFVPADETQVAATGLEGGKPVKMGQDMGTVRMYQAQNLAAGAAVKLAITGIKAAPAEAGGGMAEAGWSTRNVAIGAAFLLVLAGAALMLMKKPKPEK